MIYLLCYLVLGFVVAFVMAHMQKRRPTTKYAHFSWKMMLGAYFFIALAWPVAVAAFIYGAFSSLVLGAQKDQI